MTVHQEGNWTLLCDYRISHFLTLLICKPQLVKSCYIFPLRFNSSITYYVPLSPGPSNNIPPDCSPLAPLYLPSRTYRACSWPGPGTSLRDIPTPILLAASGP